MAESLKYAYFPGCTSKAVEKENDWATRRVAEVLGMKLIEVPEFSCCGAGVLSEQNAFLNTVLNARNFAWAEKSAWLSRPGEAGPLAGEAGPAVSILTICNTCTLNLRRDLISLKNNPDLRERANQILRKLGMEYQEKTEVTHLLWALAEDYGFDRLQAMIKKPLSGLKIAAFYGCHLLRPERLVGGHQDGENPDLLEKLIRILGGEKVEAEGKTKCCGFHITMIRGKTAAKMSGSFLKKAKEAEADLITTPCPFCQMQLDAYQSDSEKIYQEKFQIPVLHLSQLIGLALGITPKDLGLKRHLILPEKLLKF